MEEDFNVPDDPLLEACKLWLEDNLTHQVSAVVIQRALHRAYRLASGAWHDYASVCRPSELPPAICAALRAGIVDATGDPDSVAHDLPDVPDLSCSAPVPLTPAPDIPGRYPKRDRQPSRPYWAGAGAQ